jgi:hypothetical protein
MDDSRKSQRDRITRVLAELRKTIRVRIIGVLALLVLVYAVWMAVSPPIFGETRCAQSKLPSILRLEFAQSSEDVAGLIGEPGDDRRCLVRVQILRDNIWVATYMALFVAVSLLLVRRNCPWAKYLGRLAMISGIAAGIFDWRENYYILEILRLASNAVSSQLFSLREATLSKWTLIYVTMSIVAVAFFGLSRLASWIGFLYALTAAIGLIGIWDHRVIAVAQIFVPISLLLLAFAALVRPRDLVESSC